MTEFLDRLNLPPTERRLLLVGFVVAVVLLNYFAVWPYFNEWPKVNRQIEEEKRKEVKFMAEIGQRSKYERRLEDLKLKGVPGLLDAERVPLMQQTIYAQGGLSGVTITRVSVPPPVRSLGATNQFFDERLVTVDVNGGEPELVDFLYQLGSGDSMMRVRDISNLRPDISKTRLQATLTLVASFQKDTRSSVKSTPTGAKPMNSPGVRPSVPSVGGASSANAKK